MSFVFNNFIYIYLDLLDCEYVTIMVYHIQDDFTMILTEKKEQSLALTLAWQGWQDWQ